jgi:hypothetical protein
LNFVTENMAISEADKKAESVIRSIKTTNSINFYDSTDSGPGACDEYNQSLRSRVGGTANGQTCRIG